MFRYDDLTDGENVLLACEHQGLTSKDVQLLLGNCQICTANVVLRRELIKRNLSRHRIKKKFGGKKYIYRLSEKGREIVEQLHKRGF